MFIDDHSRLSSHMSQSSWMMGGGGMRIELDDQKGQAVGSHIRLVGTAFGLRLFLEKLSPGEIHRRTSSERPSEILGCLSLVRTRWASTSPRMGLAVTYAYSSTTTFPGAA